MWHLWENSAEHFQTKRSTAGVHKPAAVEGFFAAVKLYFKMHVVAAVH